MCKETIDELKELSELGIIRLAIDAESIEEFSENRLLEYKSSDKEYSIYKNLIKNSLSIDIGTYTVRNNTTIAIQQYWEEWINNTDIRGFFSTRLPNSIVPINIHQLALEALDKTKHNQAAFIIRNLYPMIFKEIISKSASNLLEKRVCEFFFNTLADEIDSCALISSLIYLPNISIDNLSCKIIYKDFYRDLQISNMELMYKIMNANSKDLINLKIDSKIINWIEKFKIY